MISKLCLQEICNRSSLLGTMKLRPLDFSGLSCVVTSQACRCSVAARNDLRAGRRYANLMHRFTHHWIPVTLLLTGLGIVAMLALVVLSGSNVVHDKVAGESPSCTSCDARHKKLQSNRQAMERFKAMSVESDKYFKN
jgi:hypothetical protein